MAKEWIVADADLGCDGAYFDYQELVRCRECVHRDPEDKKCDCGHDILWQLPRGDDWFCADGERKSNFLIIQAIEEAFEEMEKRR